MQLTATPKMRHGREMNFQVSAEQLASICMHDFTGVDRRCRRCEFKAEEIPCAHVRDGTPVYDANKNRYHFEMGPCRKCGHVAP